MRSPVSIEDLATALPGLSEEIRVFGEERDWSSGYTPRRLVLALIGEVGELAEIWRTKEDVDECVLEDKEREMLGQEIADVAIYAIHLCRVTHVELASELLRCE